MTTATVTDDLTGLAWHLSLGPQGDHNHQITVEQSLCRLCVSCCAQESGQAGPPIAWRLPLSWDWRSMQSSALAEVVLEHHPQQGKPCCLPLASLGEV